MSGKMTDAALERMRARDMAGMMTDHERELWEHIVVLQAEASASIPVEKVREVLRSECDTSRSAAARTRLRQAARRLGVPLDGGQQHEGRGPLVLTRPRPSYPGATIRRLQSHTEG